MPWVTALNAPALGNEGQLGSDPHVVQSLIASAACRAGLVCERTRGAAALGDTCAPITVLPAADTDSIITLAAAVTSVVAGQTLSGATFDGAFGQGRFRPLRVTATFSNHPGVWGLAALGGTWCRFIGLDPDGHYQTEDFFCPAGGNATVTSDKAFSQLHFVQIGACDAAGGGSTLIVGTAATTRSIGRMDYGFAAYDLAAEPSATATVTYDAGDVVPFLMDGTIWVTNETTSALAVLPGDPVGVRVVVAGADVRGQVTRASSALINAGTFALLEGAYFETAAAAGAPALVRVGGRS